jgi:hydroxyacylglutathione hydrolase
MSVYRHSLFTFYLCCMQTFSPPALDMDAFLQLRQQAEDLLIIDTRPAEAFIQGFIPGSIFTGLSEQLESIAQAILPKQNNMLVIATPGKEQESCVRLYRLFGTKILGYLSGGIETWNAHNWARDLIIEVEPDELMMDIPFDEHLLVLDVREEAAFDTDHLEQAESLPLDKLTDPGNMGMIEDQHNVYLLSQTGFRAIVAASLLKKEGIHNVRTVAGGWEAVRHQIRN